MSTRSKAAIILVMLAVVIGLSCTASFAARPGKGPSISPVPITDPVQPVASKAGTVGVTMAPPEYRMSWVYGFGGEFCRPVPTYPGQPSTATTIATLADNNFNVVVPEIRKAGDAYYDSAYEPRATDVVGGYDPLQDILTQAHARNMEVWGWIVTWRIWSKTKTPPSTHIWYKHPEWAMINTAGSNLDGNYYDLDPGVPGAQQYVCDVMKDCITKYPGLDGYNFDYIRYPGANWGYNPISKERFRREYGYMPPTTGYTDIVMDDTSVSYGGTWTIASLSGQYGSSYAYTPTSATETAIAYYWPYMSSTSKYDIYVWCPPRSDLSTKAPYTIYYNGGSMTVEVNQRANGGRWVQIAQSVEFSAGSSCYIKLGNGTGETSTYVAADAVKLVNVWGKWRRQQITNFVKKCYVEAIAINPRIKMTTDTIGWMGADPRNDFMTTRAYSEVMQDHAGWMEDHIIDVNVLMNYKRDWTGLLAPTYRYNGYGFGNQQLDHRWWSDYLAQYQASTGRHTIDGIGGYMNIMQGVLDQWGYSRAHGVGLGMYRYGATVGAESSSNPGLPVMNRNAVVYSNTSGYEWLEPYFYEHIKPAMFQNPAPLPDMPWKTNPTNGYLFGQVTDALEPNDPIYQNWVYKATVTAVGPSATYTVETDGTGTYITADANGLIDLPPGTYTVTVAASGYTTSAPTQVTVTAGHATRLDVKLGPILPAENYKNIGQATDPVQTPDGTLIGINGKVVTAILSDCVYIEEPNRTKGLQVKLGTSAPLLAEGERVDLIGKMTTIGGERVLDHVAVMTHTSGAVLGALGSNVRDLSRVPTATALLVKCAGKVSDTGMGWFTLTDGSGTIKVKCQGLVGPARGTMAMATGINAVDTIERCIRVRRQSDITPTTKAAVSSPAGTIGAGLNLISIPYVPSDQTPSMVFGAQTINNRLFLWDNLTQQFIGYSSTNPVAFGNLKPGDGFALLSTTTGGLSFEGIPMPAVDTRIACPKKGWSLISHPLTTPVLWYNLVVTDGNETKNLADAVAAGWIGRIAFTWDNTAGNYGYLGTGARGSRFDDSLRPWKAYWITTYQDNLAVIIPSGG